MTFEFLEGINTTTVCDCVMRWGIAGVNLCALFCHLRPHHRFGAITVGVARNGCSKMQATGIQSKACTAARLPLPAQKTHVEMK